MTKTMAEKSILLIVSGGVAAYKALELARLLKKSGARVGGIVTSGGEKFITPLSLASLTGQEVYTDLWSLRDEAEMGHIRLSREADLIVIAPASANMIAKMAHGLTDDLASATLLASDKPVLIAPAMNHRMWDHPATQANIKTLCARGVLMAGPEKGDMACGEHGMGRMAEPEDILKAIEQFFFERKGPLSGIRALVTAGPTHEPLDPVRFIGNRSSGKQGYAIAAALAESGADVTLVSGPTALPDPPGVKTVRVQTAREMLAACENSLPAHVAVCAAAVADWAPEKPKAQKIKKRESDAGLSLTLTENPDILRTLSGHKKRPKLVVGFAAETEDLLAGAKNKLKTKGCDWIVANNVAENAFGADTNQVYLVTSRDTEEWPRQSKHEIAKRLAERISREKLS